MAQVLVDSGQVLTKDGKIILLDSNGAAPCCGCGGGEPGDFCPCPDGSKPDRPCCCELDLADPLYCGDVYECACPEPPEPTCRCGDGFCTYRYENFDRESIPIFGVITANRQWFNTETGQPCSASPSSWTWRFPTDLGFTFGSLGACRDMRFFLRNGTVSQTIDCGSGSFENTGFGIQVWINLRQQIFEIRTASGFQYGSDIVMTGCSGGVGTVTNITDGSQRRITATVSAAFELNAYPCVDNVPQASIRSNIEGAIAAVSRFNAGDLTQSVSTDSGCAGCGGKTTSIDDLDGFAVEE